MCARLRTTRPAATFVLVLRNFDPNQFAVRSESSEKIDPAVAAPVGRAENTPTSRFARLLTPSVSKPLR
jgi:hypothetical protein